MSALPWERGHLARRWRSLVRVFVHVVLSRGSTSIAPGGRGARAPRAGISLTFSGLLLLAGACTPMAAEDPYAAWTQGRPAESIAALHQRAETAQTWHAWYDLGLAAAAAGDRGRAVAWLLEARRRAPERGEIAQALRALGAPAPTGWLDRLGPAAWPGAGWWGVGLLAGGGVALGWWALSRRRHGAALIAGLIAAALPIPGLIAQHRDGALPLAATVRDTHLLDALGAPRDEVLAAGSIVMRDEREPWAGRALVRLADGSSGYLPLADLTATP